jgi:hypothetical protein
MVMVLLLQRTGSVEVFREWSSEHLVAADCAVATPPFGENSTGFLDSLLGRVGNKLLAQSAEAGALPSLFVASQDLPGGSYAGPDGRGEYRGNPTLVGRSAEASDAELATALWDASEKLTGVSFPAAEFRR